MLHLPDDDAAATRTRQSAILRIHMNRAGTVQEFRWLLGVLDDAYVFTLTIERLRLRLSELVGKRDHARWALHAIHKFEAGRDHLSEKELLRVGKIRFESPGVFEVLGGVPGMIDMLNLLIALFALREQQRQGRGNETASSTTRAHLEEIRLKAEIDMLRLGKVSAVVALLRKCGASKEKIRRIVMREGVLRQQLMSLIDDEDITKVDGV